MVHAVFGMVTKPALSSAALPVLQLRLAGYGNDNTAIGTTANAAVDASDGNDNYAYLDGPEHQL